MSEWSPVCRPSGRLQLCLSAGIQVLATLKNNELCRYKSKKLGTMSFPGLIIMVGSGIIAFLCISCLISFIMTSFSSSVVSFVRWPFLPRCLASLLSVRTVPSVRKSWGLQCVSACQALRVRTVRSWSVSTLLTEILMFSFKMSKTGLKPTSHYR